MISSARYWYSPARESQSGADSSTATVITIGRGNRAARPGAYCMTGKLFEKRPSQNRIYVLIFDLAIIFIRFCFCSYLKVFPTHKRPMESATNYDELKDAITRAYPDMSRQLQRIARF